jgi:anti-sigma factor (TIGR02949 family)
LSQERVEHVLRELEVYLDGELSEEDCRRVERHVSECPECFDHEQFLVRLRDIVRRKCGSAALPPGLSDRIRQSLSGALE